MFLLRAATLDDLSDLYKLSQLGVFISLPQNHEMLKKIVESSLHSFQQPYPALHKNNYVFVLVDLELNEVVGVSIIHAQHGYEQEPHFYLRVSQEYKYSHSINTGFVHGVLKLGVDSNGPTEIGGLVLQPQLRNHAEKLGKQLSFVRFLYMGTHPDRFKEEIHCELMPPFDDEGNSPLWEAIGRRFMNMDYHEADQLSRRNKEFILSLFPSDTIYVTLLPMEARNAIGKVGPQTLPVQKMLESVGFKYIQEVDPFDGGPHYRCKLKDILPIKEMVSGTLRFAEEKELKKEGRKSMISLPHTEYPFAAVTTLSKVERKKDGSYLLHVNENLKEYFPEIENRQTNLIYL